MMHPFRERLARGAMAFGLVTLGMSMPPLAQESSAPAPRLVIESPTIDLGDVVKGETKEARFALRNDGDAELRILKAKPG